MYATLLKLEGDGSALRGTFQRVREILARNGLGEHLQHVYASSAAGGYEFVLFFNAPDQVEALQQTRHIGDTIRRELSDSTDRWRLYSQVAGIRSSGVW
ncbi:hypothetical protein ABZZ17_08160 [Streptomyces sp. NPDC006512]|uniref:hypothetical protein n=1 Tax=Streptomyces sp. NPDC006512 TaxID=3154307 RepID=UPI0033A57308